MTFESLRRRFPTIVNAGYATLTAGSAGLLLVLLIVAGHLLSADDYGRFSYALALTMIVETIMDIGLAHVTVRSVARDRAAAGTLYRHVLGLKLVWIGIGLAILIVIAPILRHDPEIIWLAYLMGFSSAVRSYMLTARGLLQGLDRFDIEAVVVVADRLLLLVFGTAALAGGYGLFGLAGAFVVSRTVMLVVVSMLLGRILHGVRPTYDRETWRELQAAAIPLGLFMIALNLYTYIDTVILGVMRTDAEVGYYAASYRVYEGLTYAPSILASVITPRLSYLFLHDRGGHQRLFFRVLAAAIGLGVVLGSVTVWAAHPIVVTLFGAKYAAASAPLRVLGGGALFVFGTWILHAGAISTNLDRRLLLTTGIGLVTNIGLNLVAIPRWGIVGSAWATVIAEALTVVLLFIQVARRLRAAPR